MKFITAEELLRTHGMGWRRLRVQAALDTVERARLSPWPYGWRPAPGADDPAPDELDHEDEPDDGSRFYHVNELDLDAIRQGLTKRAFLDAMKAAGVSSVAGWYREADIERVFQR